MHFALEAAQAQLWDAFSLISIADALVGPAVVFPLASTPLEHQTALGRALAGGQAEPSLITGAVDAVGVEDFLTNVAVEAQGDFAALVLVNVDSLPFLFLLLARLDHNGARLA